MTKPGIETDSTLHFILSTSSELPTPTGVRESVTKEKETTTTKKNQKLRGEPPSLS